MCPPKCFELMDKKFLLDMPQDGNDRDGKGNYIWKAGSTKSLNATKETFKSGGDYDVEWAMSGICNAKKGFSRAGKDAWEERIFPSDPVEKARMRDYWACTRCMVYDQSVADPIIAELRYSKKDLKSKVLSSEIDTSKWDANDAAK